MSGDKKIQLGGKCLLVIDTGMSISKMEIPKNSPKSGKNNADALIKDVFHFAILRHGKEKAIKMLQEQAANY
jgi:hypothetical protein